jgi:uncharacterized protein (UPF0261 family)
VEQEMQKTVAIIGTLDSKGIEYQYLKEQIEAQGVKTLVIDTGSLGKPYFPPEVSAAEVAKAGGGDLAELGRKKDRGESVGTMGRGAAVIVKELYEKGRFDGVIALGGSAGTSIGTTAMRALPTGVPKLMVSTVASGDTRVYVDVKDITMMPSVVDVAGINRLSSKILANAAGAIAGMVQAEPKAIGEDKVLIGATMFGVTTPCVTKAREILEAAGYEVLVFHCTGIGGRSMEDLIRGGFIKGVLDITTTELADEIGGGVFTAGPHRLEAAGELGIPQVVCPGALDMINFGPPDTVPDKFKDRQFYQHNPQVTLMRTTVVENRALGKLIAGKLNQAKGPATFVMPKKGVSLIAKEGGPFNNPDTEQAFLEGLKANLNERVNLIEMDTDINDEKFAKTVADELLKNL